MPRCSFLLRLAGAPAADQVDLQVVERRDIGEAVLDRAGQRRVLGEPLACPGDGVELLGGELSTPPRSPHRRLRPASCRERAPNNGAPTAKSALARTMSRFESNVRKNGQSAFIRCSNARPSSSCAAMKSRTAEPKPNQPGRLTRDWPHEKTPGDGAQVLDPPGRFARGGARADVEFGDLRDRRGGEEVIREARHLVDHGPVGRHAELRYGGGSLQEGRRRRGGGREESCLDAGGHQQFEVAAADLGVRIFARNDLALFGEADLPLHGAGRLRQDRLVARATAAPDRAAAPVETAAG